MDYEKKKYILRAQVHPLIVSPFGTGKSGITQVLKSQFSKDIFPIDNFTKPALEGSISKDGEPIPSILEKVRGKIMVIDEWNSVDDYGQQALLGILENQKLSRSLGFKVKIPYKSSKSKWGQIRMDKTHISGEIYFSCIAYAMEFPIGKEQTKKALLSRFSPIFLQPSVDSIHALTRGEFDVNIKDYSDKIKIERFKLTTKLLKELNDEYENYTKKKKLHPTDTDDLGFISRTFSEIIRYGLYSYIKENKNPQETIEDINYFKENFDFISTLIEQFSNPFTTGKMERYVKLNKKQPNLTIKEYARLLGVTRQTIHNWNNDLGIETIEQQIRKDVQNEQKNKNSKT